MTLQHACYLHVAMLMYMHVSCNMHGIGTFSMNIPCMLHEYDMHVTCMYHACYMHVPCMLHACYICMSKMDGLHVGIGNAHMQTCVGHACSSICILITCMPHACNIYDTHTYI